MLVCRMAHEAPHHHIAWEWFDHGDHFVAGRFALIGDAAVGMHPVTEPSPPRFRAEGCAWTSPPEQPALIEFLKTLVPFALCAGDDDAGGIGILRAPNEKYSSVRT